MSKRSQEGLSHDSPPVKAKSRAMNLVSHRNLMTVRQNSQSTSDPKILGSDRTDKLSLRFGRPLQGSTDESLSLRSQERPQGSTSKIGCALSEQNASPLSSGKPGRGTRNQENSEISGEDECSISSGKPVRGTQT